MGRVPGQEGSPVRQANTGDEDVLVADAHALRLEIRINTAGIGGRQQVEGQDGHVREEGFQLFQPFGAPHPCIQLEDRDGRDSQAPLFQQLSHDLSLRRSVGEEIDEDVGVRDH